MSECDGFKKFGDWLEQDSGYVNPDKLMKFNINFLDKALRGIFPDDFILAGAGTGVGKTQFASSVGMHNVLAGKRVHMFSLEAFTGEIQVRMKFKLMSSLIAKAYTKPNLQVPFNFIDFRLGRFKNELKEIEQQAEKYVKNALNNFYTYYSSRAFTAEKLEKEIFANYQNSDLFIVDHLNYFDFGRMNETEAIKVIMNTCKDLSENLGKPIILLGHLRKDFKQVKELAPNEEEFRGTSDISKIPTRIITFGSGSSTSNMKAQTFIRICKDRMDSSNKKYIASCEYDLETQEYDKRFILGRQTKTGEFEAIPQGDYPYWVKHEW